jgi:hypothetical protein
MASPGESPGQGRGRPGDSPNRGKQPGSANRHRPTCRRGRPGRSQPTVLLDSLPGFFYNNRFHTNRHTTPTHCPPYPYSRKGFHRQETVLLGWCAPTRFQLNCINFFQMYFPRGIPCRRYSWQLFPIGPRWADYI